MSRFVETPEDMKVKDRLWSATEREILRLAEWEASAHVPGDPYSDGQKDATAAAKAKGYPKGLIRDCGRILRRGEAPEGRLSEFREQIGLA